jgi:hypothetical protein
MSWLALERMRCVIKADEFTGTHKPHNFFVHEYMTEPNLFLAALIAASETPCALTADTIRRSNKGEDDQAQRIANMLKAQDEATRRK